MDEDGIKNSDIRIGGVPRVVGKCNCVSTKKNLDGGRAFSAQCLALGNELVLTGI